MSAIAPLTDYLNTLPSNALVVPSITQRAQSTDALDAPTSDSLVVPEATAALTAAASGSVTQAGLATQSTTDPLATNSTAQSHSVTQVPVNQTAQSTNVTTSPAVNSTVATAPALGTISTQPLDVVFSALATAGVDAGVNQALLTPSAADTTGTFSTFIGELFTALAAQSAAQQAAQAADSPTPSTVIAPTAAASTGTASPVSAFVNNVNSATPNSALESDVQNLAQNVSGQTAVSTAVDANAAAGTNSALSPLQQSFDQFVSDAGGTGGTNNLQGFLQSLAANLHTAQSPLGNIVDSQV